MRWIIVILISLNCIYAQDKGRLDGRVALVTGAAQGIGKEIARVLVSEGARVIIADIQDEEGHRVVQEIGDRSSYIHLDVSRECEWRSAMQYIMSDYSKLDILVNNAGITDAIDPENGTLETWQHIQSVDLEGVFLGCKYAIQMMKKLKEGSIINISSAAWTRGFPSSIAYSASKAAVTNLTKSVAVYCGQQGYNIRCNWISPGFISTPMLMKAKRDDKQEAQFQEYIKSIPLGKIGAPEDIAYAVVFLASDESKYITGTELIIDGGVTAWTGIPWTRTRKDPDLQLAQ